MACDKRRFDVLRARNALINASFGAVVRGQERLSACAPPPPTRRSTRRKRRSEHRKFRRRRKTRATADADVSLAVNFHHQTPFENAERRKSVARPLQHRHQTLFL